MHVDIMVERADMMPLTFFTLVEAAVLASSLSIDAFTAAFAYGSKNIRIPLFSIQVINGVCAAVTGAALLLGRLLKPWLPSYLSLGLAFTVLFIIGLSKLLDSLTKSIIRKHANLDKHIRFSLFNFKFIFSMYADPEAADADTSGNISPAEAAALALSLSLDGIAVGFGASLVNVNGAAVVGCSLITNWAALMLGRYVGRSIADKIPFNISWLAGVVLIVLAFSKLC